MTRASTAGAAGIRGASSSVQESSSNDPEAARQKVLIEAVVHNDVVKINEVLDETSDPAKLVNDLSPATGLAPLHYAAARGYLHILRLLIEKCAEIDRVDREGETPLFKAAYSGHIDVIQTLLRNGAKTSHTDTDGWSALHNCASGGHLLAARALIEADADVNAKSKTGHTPLMSAGAKGHLDLVELLLNNGADPLVKNSFGDSAYDLAAQAEEAYICDVLENAEQNALARLSDGRTREGKGPEGAIDHSTVVETIYENERGAFLTRKFSAANLVTNDARTQWTTPAGKSCALDDVNLPEVRDPRTGQSVRGWFWLTDWRVETKHFQADGEGWQYAKTFDTPTSQWVAAPVGMLNSWVRRRRWTRVRKRRADVTLEESAGGSSSAASASGDYVAKARKLVDDLPAIDGEGDLGHVRAELEAYHLVIQQLLGGIKADSNKDRQREASALVTGYIERAEELDALLDATGSPEEGSEGNQHTNSGQTSSDIDALLRAASEGRQQNGTSSRTETALVNGTMNATASASGSGSMDGISTSVPADAVNGVQTAVPLSMTPISAWQPDEDAPECGECKKRFNLWLRRHHCRWCGKVFCASCSSERFMLYPHSPPSRVCTSCYRHLSQRNASHNDPPSRPSVTSPTRRSPSTPTITAPPTSTAILTQQERDAISPSSPTRSIDSGTSSTMAECPVCQRPLESLPEEESERHVKECLDRVATPAGSVPSSAPAPSSFGGRSSVSGNRYLVQTLKEDIEGRECAICFEEFLGGQRIARLNCLCLYHVHCIEAWYQRGTRACPVHYE
ncbi:uncharacterized protein EV422DRAFT_500720 [Fimicolochytrium jonesii]|uniref:uncharacterized protein n=1 Tax=Fimicolochytrium jonesii TaxID=1396493 RepID=UPI0022FED79F|nr:uncharacterized protein EV422DRAFT_500720 [Fimicolochytrium jonesii]KAI8816813.1 hypothetical protein EV422DRAFT_500720 [Fimicolochytrium jonesii]